MIRLDGKRFLIAGILWIGSTNPSLAQASNETPSAAQTVRAVVTAKTKIEIRTELSARVEQADFRKGMPFLKGDNLVTFDCKRYEAERAAASASANAASIELRQKRTLLKHGAAGKGEVELAGAAVAKSLSERDVIDQRLKDCSITAPFNGIVVSTTISTGEMPKPGEPILVIIDESNLEIELVMPSNWLSKVREGSEFRFEVDETGGTIDGMVDRFGAEVDPVSQTIEVIGKFKTTSRDIRSGMSGSVTFDETPKGGT